MKVCPFFSFLHHAHRSHLWTHPHAQYVIIGRFRSVVQTRKVCSLRTHSLSGTYVSAFWGLER